MAGPFLTRDYEHAAQKEAVFGTSPGALVGGDFFKSKTRNLFTRKLARYDRTADADYQQADILQTFPGKESCDWAIDSDLIPAGAGTPTKPDMDLFFEAHMGLVHAATAHTTTAAGSSGVTLNLTAGGGAASGIQIGDLIAVDVSSAAGYEVRQVTNIVTDVVTVDRAFTTDPAAARTVKVGVTFRWSSTALITLHLWEYLLGDNFRHKSGGCAVRNMELACDFSGASPVGTVKFSGEGQQIATHSTARPTPVYVGSPVVPTKSYAYIGATKACVIQANVTSDNGLVLRNNQSCALVADGVKRTENDGGRFAVNQMLKLLLTTTGSDVYFDNAAALTAYDIIVQIGVTPGSIVAWRTKNFRPDVPVSEQDGEASLDLTGRCYGSAGDDSLVVAFI
jgi:hypothetical protein